MAREPKGSSMTPNTTPVPTTCPACLAGTHEDPAYTPEKCDCPCHGKPASVAAPAIPPELAEAQREWREWKARRLNMFPRDAALIKALDECSTPAASSTPDSELPWTEEAS